jgi:hypothetical protein
MFKQISLQEVRRISEFDMDALELFTNRFYQIKLIDFDMSVGGKLTERTCPGATKGYYPMDLFAFPHDKLDVYSLAVTMFNMELNERGYGFFSEVDREIIITVQNSEALKFSEESIKNLQSQPIYELILAISQIDESKSVLLQDIKEKTSAFPNPLTDEILQNKSIEEYMFTDARVFKTILKSCLFIYWNMLYASMEVPQDLDAFGQIIDKLKNMFQNMGNSNDLQNLIRQDEINYYKARSSLIQKEIPLRIELINCYMKIIFSPYESRDTIDQLVEKIKTIKDKYEIQMKEEIDIITNYRRRFMELKSHRFEFKSVNVQNNFINNSSPTSALKILI